MDKQTNFDKIKSMDVEQLAMMLMCPAEYDAAFNRRSKCTGGFDNNCLKCTKEWLESEAGAI